MSTLLSDVAGPWFAARKSPHEVLRAAQFDWVNPDCFSADAFPGVTPVLRVPEYTLEKPERQQPLQQMCTTKRAATLAEGAAFVREVHAGRITLPGRPPMLVCCHGSISHDGCCLVILFCRDGRVEARARSVTRVWWPADDPPYLLLCTESNNAAN